MEGDRPLLVAIGSLNDIIGECPMTLEDMIGEMEQCIETSSEAVS